MDGAQTKDERLWKLEAKAIGVGAAGGIIAGVGMGLILQFGTELLPVFGAFAGETSLLRGWLVHLIISILYGVFFTIIVAYPPVQGFMESFDVTEYMLAGVTYAVMIAAVTIAILPFIFELPWVTSASQPPFPRIPGPGIEDLVPGAIFGIAHMVYGAILGFVYALFAPIHD